MFRGFILTKNKNKVSRFLLTFYFKICFEEYFKPFYNEIEVISNETTPSKHT